MINKLPIIGWILSFVASVSLAIPFYIFWNWLAPTYFYQIPKVYQEIPFWHCVGLFIIVPIFRDLLTPKFVSVTQSNSNKD